MRDEFEQWLINKKFATSTIANYSSAIISISEHYTEQTKERIDIYKIDDINKIYKLIEIYGTNGKYDKFGKKRSGANIAALKAYAEFIIQRNRDPVSTPDKEDKLEVISKAFRLILPILARYIGKILIKKDENNWWRKFVLGKLRDENTLRKLPKKGSDDDYIESLDILACLNIIECNWVEVFRDIMDDRQRTWAHVLRDIRNYFEGHYTIKTLTTSSVEDISLELAIMIRFIRPIDTYVADRISEMKKALENKSKDEDSYINNKKPETTNSRDYSLYIFNEEILNKRQLVLAVINKYISDNPNNTLETLQNIFNKNIVDSYDNAQKNTDGKRHFFGDAINLNNGQRIVVSNQWGKDNIPQFIQKANELGYNITKKED